MRYDYKKILFITVLGIAFVFYNWISANYSRYNNQWYAIYHSLKSNTTTDICQIPKLDPYDPIVLDYIKPPQILKCRRFQPEITFLSNKVIYFNNSELQSSNLAVQDLNCQYRCFWRKRDSDTEIETNSWKVLANGTEISCEFIETACWKGISPLRFYTNLHSQIIPPEKEKNQKKKSKKAYNVLLFVLDSISQSNWRRYLPQTLSILENEYKSIIFQGFTKVGDNSFPNAVAFLTGRRSMIAGYDDELPSDMKNTYFDDWPIVWKDYKSAGYATYYAEDYPDFNLFKYLAKGFKTQPTDHYFRPFWLQLYGSFLHRRSTHLCYGNRACHNIQMDYLNQFINAYEAKPFFALNWLTELGHDWLHQVSIGDEDIAEFFRKKKTVLEKNTFVFVFADHGHRFDPIRQTIVGRIEERMPFFSMTIPESYRQEHSDIDQVIKTNARQLASFWDLYATLQDILDPSRVLAIPRGLSLLQPLPLNRSCFAAGVPDDFCICQIERPMAIDNEKIIKAASIIMGYINDLLINYPECSKLRLDTIKQAQTFLPPESVVRSNLIRGKDAYVVMYRIGLITKPSGAFLEATVEHDLRNNNYQVHGNINRINRYGNQSYCVSSQTLRKYCYCLK